MAKFYRYSNEDEDDVAARTLPGVHPKGAFFTRGSGHNKLGGYTEIPDEYQEVMDRLLRKHRAAARGGAGAGSSSTQTDATFGIISLGGCDPRGARGARRCCAERGVVADYMRIRALPVRRRRSRSSWPRTTRVFVVEQNRDAQLRSLLTLETAVAKDKLRSILVYGGFPLSSRARRRRRRPQPAASGAGSRMPSSPNQPSPTRTCARTSSGSRCATTKASMSTLCAGCGHDSVTAAIVRAFWELDTPPHMIAKLSRHRLLVEDADVLRQRRARLQLGARAHAVDRDRRQRRQPRAHLHRHLGRRRLAVDRPRPAVRTPIRRNVDMLYVIENNGVYGLTKGQFSASADVGSKSKRGEANRFSRPSIPCCWRSTLGATFVARSFSGDKAQLVPILKAALSHTRLRAGRRHLAVRDLQRSRGLDQELPAHAQAPAQGGAGRLRAAGAGDHRAVRRGRRRSP